MLAVPAPTEQVDSLTTVLIARIALTASGSSSRPMAVVGVDGMLMELDDVVDIWGDISIWVRDDI